MNIREEIASSILKNYGRTESAKADLELVAQDIANLFADELEKYIEEHYDSKDDTGYEYVGVSDLKALIDSLRGKV